jgi:hypothetical protein
MRELIIDSFAAGEGASTGIETLQAPSRLPDQSRRWRSPCTGRTTATAPSKGDHEGVKASVRPRTLLDMS